LNATSHLQAKRNIEMPIPTPSRIVGFITIFLIAILGLSRMYSNLENQCQLPSKYPSGSVTRTDLERTATTAAVRPLRRQYILSTSLSQTSTITAVGGQLPSIHIRQTLPSFPQTTSIPASGQLLNLQPHQAQPSSTSSAQTNTISAPAQLLNQDPACCLVSSAIELCTSLTPYFMALPQMSQAECLCFSSTQYKPGLFDGAVSSCAQYASTAVAAAWNALNDLEGFCTRASPYLFPTSTSVLSAYAPSTSTLSAYVPPPAIVTQPPPTMTETQVENQQCCSIVQNIIFGCVNQTPGFLTLSGSNQASCLCSSTLTVGSETGIGFDNAAKGCLSALSTGGSATLSVALRSFLGGDGGVCGQYSGQAMMSSTTMNPVGGNGTMGIGSGLTTMAITPVTSLSSMAVGVWSSTSTMVGAAPSSLHGTGSASASSSAISTASQPRNGTSSRTSTSISSSTDLTNMTSSQTSAASSSTPNQTQNPSAAPSSTFTSTTFFPPTSSFTRSSKLFSITTSLSTTASFSPIANANDSGLRIVGKEQVVVISFLCAVLGMGTFLS
jgi:hypothetical protein